MHWVERRLMCDTIPALVGVEGFDAGYRALRETAGLIDLSWKKVLAITGDDRKGWLQGQVTQDLRPFDSGGFTQFCLCSPTGQLEAIAGVWAFPDRYLVVLHEDSAPALAKRIEKLVIMEDIQSAPVEEAILSIQGPEATEKLSELMALPSLDAGRSEIEGSEVIVLRSNRTGLGGWDLIVPLDATKALKKLRKAFVAIDREAYLTASLEAGMPQFGIDTDSKTLPPELGPAFEAATVSYSKGCYAGQEVLMRIHSRGHTNRTWVGLLCDGPVSRGDSIAYGSKPEMGRVTTAAFSPEFGYIAAGYVRNEIAMSGELVRIERDDQSTEAEVAEMPLLRLG